VAYRSELIVFKFIFDVHVRVGIECIKFSA
jgi:hypothetical protein